MLNVICQYWLLLKGLRVLSKAEAILVGKGNEES